jgi:hypothetical protein
MTDLARHAARPKGLPEKLAISYLGKARRRNVGALPGMWERDQ